MDHPILETSGPTPTHIQVCQDRESLLKNINSAVLTLRVIGSDMNALVGAENDVAFLEFYRRFEKQWDVVNAAWEQYREHVREHGCQPSEEKKMAAAAGGSSSPDLIQEGP